LEGEVPVVGHFGTQESVSPTVTVATGIVDPQIVTAVNQEECKRCLLVTKNTIARIDQTMLVDDDRLLLFSGVVFGVGACIGASHAIDVEHGVVVAVPSFVNKFLQGILVHLADLEEGAVLVLLLNVLLILHFYHFPDLLKVPTIILIEVLFKLFTALRNWNLLLAG
jgi:hypothetical protein